MCGSLPMRQQFRWCIGLLVILTIAVYYYESASVYAYHVYEYQDGYGYCIKRNRKVLIQQDFVPTRTGYRPFEQKKYATKAAQLVIAKLKKNETPALSAAEVNSIMEK